MTQEYIQKHLGAYIQMYNNIVKQFIEHHFDFYLINGTGITIKLKTGVIQVFDIGSSLFQTLSLELMQGNLVRVSGETMNCELVSAIFNADDVAVIQWNLNTQALRAIEEVTGKKIYEL